ncbi:protein POLAR LOCALIZATION DURING ASYMMETRIC DIVISION AND REDISTRIBUTION [Senna tora]|uniref:Protein POLAR LOCALIZATION DURING ASYMMETRIC DIVISION AND REDISTRIBUTION n=1 Tax=Senna tora TaxID=362788 RepID=A0A834U417_9FABA|nr:protein POLAR LOCALIZATION DURING ASYMMETRIC DIVISION AND REDISTRIBUTION [Senna tora]
MKERFYKSFRLPLPDHSTHTPLRVADILLDREDDSDGDDCIGQSSMDGVREIKQRRHVHYYSPCQIAARLLTRMRRAKKQRVSQQKHKVQKEPTEFESPSVSASRSVNGLSCNEEPAGQYRNDTSFKLGVSCGLLYMIAASKNEFSKMIELRKEMEMLIQHAKEQLPRKEAPPKPLKKMDTLACSITDIQDVSSSNSHILVQSQPMLERNMVHNHFIEYNLSEQDECVEGIHDLEAELEVELERLQLYLNEDTTFEDRQEMVKVTVMDSSTQSHSMSFGEIIDPQEARNDMSFGVHPIELERRLHELIEARMQERITDLEYALECARQKVAEKETEVTWWKDTARLISQHVPETSRFTFRLDPEATLRLKGEHSIDL